MIKIAASGARRWFGAITVLLGLTAPALADDPYKVLVVMSYEKDNPWVQEIQDGIEGALGDTSEVTYAYMDTKIDLKGGPQKAKTAFEVFTNLAPDGVITVDDNAQSMFVLPYLLGKTDVPIMFSGVNAEPEKYGYPADQVSGILERGHIRETISYLQQLDPSIKRISFLTRDSPSGNALQRQVEAEREGYSAGFAGFYLVTTIKELRVLANELRTKTDAIFIDSLEGIEDAAGRGLANKEVLGILSNEFRGPIVGANRYHVDQGALTAVVKTGQEQGRRAAEMLLRAMRGTPVSNIPIMQNNRGRRVINVGTMKKLGMKPRPIDLRGALLVQTQD